MRPYFSNVLNLGLTIQVHLFWLLQRVSDSIRLSSFCSTSAFTLLLDTTVQSIGWFLLFCYILSTYTMWNSCTSKLANIIFHNFVRENIASLFPVILRENLKIGSSITQLSEVDFKTNWKVLRSTTILPWLKWLLLVSKLLHILIHVKLFTHSTWETAF